MLNTAKDFIRSIETEVREKDSEELFRVATDSLRNGARVAGAAFRRLLQVQGARAVDRAIVYLGLGQYGVRMSSIGLGGPRELWEAELPIVSAASIAEAAERITAQALAETFEIGSAVGSAAGSKYRSVRGTIAAERAELGELTVRWMAHPSNSATPGLFRLSWTKNDSESFRRQTLSSLKSGASQRVAAQVVAPDGRLIAEVEMEWKAWARPPLPAKEG